MSKITITVIGESKSNLLKELLENRDFVQYMEEQESGSYSAFEESFGIWENRNIELNVLRKRAWRQSV